MNIPAAIVVASWVVFMVVWLVSAFFAKRTVPRSWLRGVWVRIAAAAGVLLWIVVARPHRFFAGELYLRGAVAHTPLNMLGAALTALGVALALWARYHLGRNWGQPMTLRQEPELVVSGPYAWVRHPIYAGAILAMIGTGFLNFWWFFIAAAGGIFYMRSALVEERDMERAFPDVYPAYKARTWRLVPYIF